MKNLTEDDVVTIIREEWSKKMAILKEEQITVLKTPVISSGLKIRHKTSGTLYTVDSVGPSTVVIKDPVGAQKTIPSDKIESEFELN